MHSADPTSQMLAGIGYCNVLKKRSKVGKSSLTAQEIELWIPILGGSTKPHRQERQLMAQRLRWLQFSIVEMGSDVCDD